METKLLLKPEDIKNLGIETAYIYQCISCDMSDNQIIEHCNINEAKLLKAKKKLNKAGYLDCEVIYHLKKDNAKLVHMCEPISIVEEVKDDTEPVEEDYETKQLNEYLSRIDLSETEPVKEEVKSQDEILFDLNQKIYMQSHNKQMKTGEVFNFDNKDKASLAEMEMFPPTKKYHTTL